MAEVNILDNGWQTESESSTINITVQDGSQGTSVEFDMGSIVTNETAWAKACIAIDASKYKTIKFVFSGCGYDSAAIFSLECGVYDNMTPSSSSGKVAKTFDFEGTGITNNVNIDISSMTGTKYVGFRFYGDTCTINDDVDSVCCYMAISSLTAVERGYTLTYDANGGSGAPDSVSDIMSTTISSIIPIRPGYKFLCWVTVQSGVGVSYNAGDSIQLDSDTVLYASWHRRGLVYISDDTGVFNLYEIYIYDDSGWNLYMPYVYTESGWEMCS